MWVYLGMSAVEQLFAIVWCRETEEITRLKARHASEVKQSLRVEGRGIGICL